MKLFLMAFGFLIAATVSAQEPKGSFELSPTNPTVAMVNVEENKECDRSGDIGMSADGLILSCQSGSWKAIEGAPPEREVRRCVRFFQSYVDFYKICEWRLCAGGECTDWKGGEQGVVLPYAFDIRGKYQGYW